MASVSWPRRASLRASLAIKKCVQPDVRFRPCAAGAACLVRMLGENADVAEPVDATDLKSVEGDLVRVRVPPSAPAPNADRCSRTRIFALRGRLAAPHANILQVDLAHSAAVNRSIQPQSADRLQPRAPLAQADPRRQGCPSSTIYE